jgi:hypothetical protein
MTKPANFPGAKNRRRINALYRLERSKPISDYDKVMGQKQIEHLRSIIVDQDRAESTETKKFRGR